MLKIQLGLTKIYVQFHNFQLPNSISQSDWSASSGNEIQKAYNKETYILWKHLQQTTQTCSVAEAITGIYELRDLHVQMDLAVLAAYGWDKDGPEGLAIDLCHDFYEVDYLPENDRIRYTIHPDARREILKRLLLLNHRIHDEEVRAGLWDNKVKANKRPNQAELDI